LPKPSAAAIVVALAATLAACSPVSESADLPTPGPGTSRWPTTAVTVDPPSTVKAGPRYAPACRGVRIRPGEDPQRVIDAHPGGTTFCFTAGRHPIRQPLRPTAGSTLASSERAVLAGSVRLTGWQPEAGHWVLRGALPAAYPPVGQCEDDQANLCHWREQLFAGRTHLRRVAGTDRLEPDTFYADYAGNAIHLGSDPSGRVIEMSSTGAAIGGGAEQVTVRGLTVERFASPSQSGAIEAGRGWRVEFNEIRDNHAVGLKLARADDAVVAGNLVTANGQLGISQWRSPRARITRNEIARNNTDGFWIADWESGGIKSTWSSGRIEGNHVHDNLGIGIWSDIDERDKTISGNRITGNAACGIRYEISYRGTIAGNVVTGNGFGVGRTGAGGGATLFDGGGINVNTSTGVRVTGNVVDGNRNGIAIQSRRRGSGEYGEWLLRDVEVTGNTVAIDAGTATTGAVFLGDAGIPAGEVRFRDNRYRLDSADARRFNWLNQLMTADEWRKAGNDENGSFG
jgi:parallel beta-helix repeat protein